jgi:hypothetical protein
MEARRGPIWTAFLVLALIALAVALPLSMAPAPAETPELTFAVFGDCRGELCGQPTTSPILDELLLRQINKSGASFAIFTGDAYGGYQLKSLKISDGQIEMVIMPASEEEAEQQASIFLDKMKQLEIPWYPVIGDHEAVNPTGWNVYKELIFKGEQTYYSFDKGNCHFVILDTYMPETYKPGAWSFASLSPEQMDWLREDLPNTDKAHIFVSLHSPLYPIGPHIGMSLDDDPEVRDELAELLADYNVDAVFCGHEHLYSRLQYKGVLQITTGGAGAPLAMPRDIREIESLYPGISNYEAISTYHYTIVQVKGEEVSITVYGLKGQVIDQFNIIEHEMQIPVPLTAWYETSQMRGREYCRV